MRGRQEILDQAGQDAAGDYATCLEVLLDLRDIAQAWAAGSLRTSIAKAKASGEFQKQSLQFLKKQGETLEGILHSVNLLSGIECAHSQVDDEHVCVKCGQTVDIGGQG